MQLSIYCSEDTSIGKRGQPDTVLPAHCYCKVVQLRGCSLGDPLLLCHVQHDSIDGDILVVVDHNYYRLAVDGVVLDPPPPNQQAEFLFDVMKRLEASLLLEGGA